MSLTSYQAAPPRVLRNLIMPMLRKTQIENPKNEILSRGKELKNSGGHGQLVGSGFCREMVSEKHAGRRVAGVQGVNLHSYRHSFLAPPGTGVPLSSAVCSRLFARTVPLLQTPSPQVY